MEFKFADDPYDVNLFDTVQQDRLLLQMNSSNLAFPQIKISQYGNFADNFGGSIYGAQADTAIKHSPFLSVINIDKHVCK